MKLSIDPLRSGALLVWVAGLLASGWLASSIQRNNQVLLEQRLNEVTAETVEMIQSRFGLYEYGLRGARGAVAAAGGATLTREQFEAYINSRNAQNEFPGSRGFGFIRPVPRQLEGEFLDAVRLDGRPEFEIREIEPHPHDRFVIEHLYPINDNEATQGLDIASETNRREAALIAARAAQARITAPITLVQAEERPGMGLMMLLPVYPNGPVPLSPDERMKSLVGWVFTPLLLDEVLADLGPRAYQIQISLVLEGDDKPFFDTATGLAAATEAPTGIAPVSQFLRVYGQSWRLNATATQALVQDSRITSHTDVAVLGASASTVLSLLLFFIGQNRRARLAAQRRREFGTLPPVRRSFTVWAFAASGLALRSALLFIASAGLLGVWQYYHELGSQQKTAERDLGTLVKNLAQVTEDRQSFRDRTLRFLAASPSLRELVRAQQNGGIDPISGASAAALEVNLQQVFAGYLGTSPETRQISLVGVANNGRELVRVQQRGGTTAAATALELSTLGAEPYVRDTLRLERGEVLTSDLVLHREHGALSVPHWPTARYSMPVYDDQGRVFGALVITVDARGILENLAPAPNGNTQIFITNGSGDYLVHPNPDMVFGFEYGQPHRWDNDFQLLEPEQQSPGTALRRWRTAAGDVLSTREVLTPNPGSNVGQLHFIGVLPVSSLHQAAWNSLRTGALLMLALGAAGFTFLYFYWVSAQRTLQARSERLRLATIVDQTSDAIIGLDTQGTVLSWNRGAQALFGYAPKEAVGRSLAELIVPEGQAPEELQALADLNADTVGVSLEAWRRNREGQVVEVAISLSPLLDYKGQVAGASAIVRDVTEERAAQRRVIELNSRLEQDVQDRTATLQAERERLDHIIRGTDAGTWEWNLQTGEKRYNQRWADMIGYTLEEIGPEGKVTWDDIVHPGDKEVAVAALNRHFSGEAEQYEVEMRLRHKDGHWVWVLDRGRVTSRTPDGQPEWLRGIHLDVTQTHLARERLASSEELLDRTGRVAGIGGWDFEVATWTLAWTPPMYDICEVYPDFELTPEVPLQFFTGNEREQVKAALDAARKQGIPFDMEVPFITATGRRLQVRLAGEAIRNLKGEVVRVVGAMQDVTARHVLDAEMRRINQLQQSILENMPCALSAFDADLRLVAWNTQFIQLLELEPLFEKGVPTFEDILRFNAARGEYGTENVEAAILQTLEKARHPEPHSFERVRPNGMPLEIRGTPMPDGGFVTTYTDMSDRKRAEENIARSEALLRGAIEAVDEAFVLYDPDDRLVLSNEKYRSLYDGIRDMLVPGNKFEDIIRASAERNFHILGEQSIDDWVAERMVAHRSGDAYFVQRLASGRVLRVIERQLPDGHTVGFRIDITDLVRATDEAEAASKAKGEFLANMSHEIRTPLNAVIGLSHMLADTELQPKQQELLKKSLMASKSLLGIINDVLDLAKIEAGELTLLPEPFRLDELLGDLDNLFREQAQNKQLAFSVEGADTLPSLLIGDSLRMRQILTNLVGNAIKFTKAGSVRVHVRSVTPHADDPEGTVRLRAEVRDTGLGISPEAQAKLFAPFTQADASTTRQFGGTGLGLSIVRRLAEAMGGQVGLHSVLGEGSTFWFELPLGLPDAAGSKASTRDTLEIVVVDDQDADRRALIDLARAFGWQTQAFESGEALVEWMCERAASGHVLPDAMLVDWQLGGIDGLQALAQLNERIRMDQLPAALMVSSTERERLQALDTQHLVTDILTKPVNGSVLFNAVNHGLVSRHGSTDRVMPLVSVQGQNTLWLPGVRVLLVDDSEINLEIAQHLLNREGAQVVTGGTGRQALQRLEEAETPFDVVLMDVQMPDMDGLEATRQLRKNPAHQNLPVIALTAGALAEERRRTVDAGMNAFLTKPLDPQMLVRTVRQAIESATGMALPVRQAEPATTDRASDWPEIEGIDSARAAQRLGGDTALLRSSLRRLFNEFGPWADTPLPQPLSPEERIELAARAHKLKGSAGLIDAAVLHREAGLLESALRDGRMAFQCMPHWQAIAESLQALQKAAAPFMAAGNPPAQTAAADAPPLDPAVLRQLCDLLEQQDLSVLSLVEDHEAALRAHLGPATHDQLTEKLDNLDFAGAADLLTVGSPK